MSDVDLGIRLVGDDVLAPCLDGIDRPYLSLDAAASTAAMPSVAARVADVLPATRASIAVPAGSRSCPPLPTRRHARPPRRSPVGRPRRRGHHLPQHHRGDQPPRVPARARARRRRRDDGRRAPRQPPPLVEAGSLPLRRLRGRRHLRRRRRDRGARCTARARSCSRSPAPRTSPAGFRRSTRSSRPPTSGACRCSSTRRSSPRTARCRSRPTSSRGAGTRCTRPSVPVSCSARGTPSRRAIRSSPAAAPVDLVDLDEVVWTDPPEREEAGSPNVLGAVALHAAIDELTGIGWPAIRAHDDAMAKLLRDGLRGVEGVRLLGAPGADGLPVVPFVVDGVPHALVAARLSVEHAIGVRHGCFCAHPYLMRLLGLTPAEISEYRDAVRRGDKRAIPGAVRASTGISTTAGDIERFVAAVAAVALGEPAPVPYDQDPHTGDYWPRGDDTPWADAARRLGAVAAPEAEDHLYGPRPTAQGLWSLPRTRRPCPPSLSIGRIRHDQDPRCAVGRLGPDRARGGRNAAWPITAIAWIAAMSRGCPVSVRRADRPGRMPARPRDRRHPPGPPRRPPSTDGRRGRRPLRDPGRRPDRGRRVRLLRPVRSLGRTGGSGPTTTSSPSASPPPIVGSRAPPPHPASDHPARRRRRHVGERGDMPDRGDR